MQIAIAVTIGMMIGGFLGMLLMCVLTGGKNADLDGEVFELRRKLDEKG